MKGTCKTYFKEFVDVLEDSDGFIISPGCKTEVKGYMYQGRVDRDIVPEGWHAYDVRHGDSGNPCTVEEKVVVNHYGTFLTQQEIDFKGKDYRSLSGRGGYTYAEYEYGVDGPEMDGIEEEEAEL